MPTILGYLTSENPTLDNENSRQGVNTTNIRWSPITGLEDWSEFTYETLMSSYGAVLSHQFSPFPDIDPLDDFDCEIWDEDSFEHLLTKGLMPAVKVALKRGSKYCEQNWSKLRGLDYLDVGRGGRASRASDNDPRLRPDWSGVHEDRRTDLGYFNLCPGETKLATKWQSRMTNLSSYVSPFAQIQTYCGDMFNVRYGYLITQAELVVVRVSREQIDTGLATTRSSRQPVSHARNTSITSDISSMSLTSSSYQDDHPNTEYNALQFKSIPWASSGKGKLTVKLGLWWIHMLACAEDTSVKSQYPPLDSWVLSSEWYVHVSTGQCVKKRPKNATVISEQESQTSAGERVVLSDASGFITVEAIAGVKWESTRKVFLFKTKDDRGGSFEWGTYVWSSSRQAYCLFKEDGTAHVLNPEAEAKGKGKKK